MTPILYLIPTSCFNGRIDKGFYHVEFLQHYEFHTDNYYPTIEMYREQNLTHLLISWFSMIDLYWKPFEDVFNSCSPFNFQSHEWGGWVARQTPFCWCTFESLHKLYLL